MLGLTAIALLFLPLPSICGQTGAAWISAEVTRTKSRLWEIMKNPRKFVNKSQKPAEHGACGTDCWVGCDAFDLSREHEFCTHCEDTTCPSTFPSCQCCRGWCATPSSVLEPSAAKFLRLAFHDCLLYTDGSGGCDGCLEWTNMGISYEKKESPPGNGPYDKTFSDPGDINNGKGDNNNLHMTVLALEHVFKDSNLGDGGQSLLAAGKSRADLWALAGIVAVEFTVSENNLACKTSTLPWTRKGNFVQGCGSKALDTSDCLVAMPNIPFRTGRTDCDAGAEPYIATKTEVHPSAFFNGPTTLEWFETNFGLTEAKDVVALMGAHTLGKLDQRNSLMKYTWTRGTHSYFNNQFYKNMVDDKDYLIQCRKESNLGFILVGEPDSSKGAITWQAHGRGWMEGGGPFSWRRNMDICFDGGVGKSGVGKMLQVFDTEPEIWENCFNASSQLVGGGPGWRCDAQCRTPNDFVDEIMLSSDMGLFLDFTVDNSTGRILGYGVDGSVSCPGLVDANKYAERWNEGKPSGPLESGCREAATADLVKLYATDQATWVTDFASAFDKVLSNGYSQDSLDVAEYGCCTRIPPTMDNKPFKGSLASCDPAAVC